MSKKTNAKTNGNGKLNNAQRKALAFIVQNSFTVKIQEARDKNGEFVDKIKDEIKDQLGYNTLQNQIGTLKKQIAILEDKQGTIGFNRYGSLDGKAKRLLDQRVGRSSPITTLEKERDKKLAAVWMAQTLSEAKKAIQTVL